MTGEILERPNLTPWESEHGVMPRAEVDLVNPYVEQPHYEAMIEAVRREGPIVFYEYEGDPAYEGFWIVTDNELARKVLAAPNIYSSHGTSDGGGIMIHDMPPDLDMARELMIMLDGDEHSVQRALVSEDFRHKSLKVVDYLRSLAHKLIDAAVTEGEVDFVKAVATPIPLAAITEMLGIPEAERDLFYELGNSITMVDNPPGSAVAIDFEAAAGIVLAADQLRPRVTSGEIQSPILRKLNDAVHNDDEEPTAERPISSFQFDAFFVLLFLAGNETTRNTLAHGAHMFAEHPKQWELLKEQPDLLGSAADEIVRWATPVRYLRRTALREGQVGDAMIQPGEKVVVSLTGANRDPSVFERPHEFDIERNGADAVAFGQGRHYCLGRHLAKVEIQVVLEAMLEQVDTIELTTGLKRMPASLINNVDSLGVRLVGKN